MDYSTFEGALRLRAKIERAGGPRDLEVYRVGNDNQCRSVYGLRRPLCESRGTELRRGGEWNARIISLCADALEAHPGVTLEEVLAGGKAPHIVAARHDCIRVCDKSGVTDGGLGLTRRKLAFFFGVGVRALQRALEATEPQQVAA